MKLIKSLTIVGLSSLLAVSTVQAVEKTAAKQTTAKQTTAKQDYALTQFNKNVGLQLVKRGIQTGENNQSVATLTYLVQNKGKNKIKSINWISGYTIDNKVFYAQEIPLNFQPALPAQRQMEVTINLPLNTLPEAAQKIFLDKSASVGAINGAKNVVFSNGKRITVSK